MPETRQLRKDKPHPVSSLASIGQLLNDLTIDLSLGRDGANKLVRRSYWLDMDDRTLVMVMVNGIGANLTNDENRAHLTDLRREHLIDQVCERWSRVSEQILRVDKWSVCQG